MENFSELEITLVGVTGEYYVAAELSIRGHLACITLRDSRGIDIIASNAAASRSVSIQVKTNKGGRSQWMLGKKAETYANKDFFYLLVSLQGIGVRPDFYIVPIRVVAKQISTSHKQWLAGTKKDGTARKDSSIRLFRYDLGKYKETWDLLKLS